jgi:AcrR family transcriptional regulator
VSGTHASGTRKDKALATRRRILAAAYELLCELGYAATTIAAIAKRAGVAEQTLYFTFRSKPAILTEVIHASVAGFDRWTPTLDADVRKDHLTALREGLPWFVGFEAEPNPRRAIERYFEACAEIFERVGPLFAALSGSGVPELSATLARSEALRADAAGLVLGALKKKGSGLRADLKPARARDIFLTLTSTALYNELTMGRGWSQRQATQWLAKLVADQLLA